MANKKRIFKNKPGYNLYGRYLFLSNNNNLDHELSDSVPQYWDKFIDKDLYTAHEDHPVNKAIVDSMIEYPDGSAQDYLKYSSDTFFRIDELVLARRPGIQYGIKDRRIRMYIFSAYGTPVDTVNPDNTNEDETPYRNPYNEDGTLKSWSEYRNDLWRSGTSARQDAGEGATVMNKYISGVGQTADPGPVSELEGYVLMTNLNAVQFNELGDPTGDYPIYNDAGLLSEGGTFLTTKYDAFVNHPNVSWSDVDYYIGAFNIIPPPDEEDSDDPPPTGQSPGGIGIIPDFHQGGGKGGGLPASTRTENPISACFQQDGQYNPIWISIEHKGDASKPGGGNDFSRNDRIQTYKINQSDLFYYTDEGDIFGKETAFEFGPNDSLIMDETGQYAVAQTITSLKVTINTFGYDDVNVNADYQNFLEQVTQPQPRVDLENLDERFLKLSPTNEIFFTSRLGITESTSLFSDWTPLSTVTLIDDQHELQAYYEDEKNRIKSSSPTTIELDISVGEAKQTFTDGEEIVDRTLMLPEGLNIGYAYFVITWDDFENEFEEWEKVLDDYPLDFEQLVKKQDDNLYKAGIVGRKSLRHSYTTPGIKTIRLLMFNYEINSQRPYNAEPIRWKLVTVRHFLDIPKNSYPDFGELGGNDYVTIPWPYTVPVVGGLSSHSKYLRSVENTLQGGKIGENEIIDEYFLFEAEKNDELGKNVEKIDLEQVRFFNRGVFDMHYHLGFDSEDMYEPEFNPEYELINQVRINGEFNATAEKYGNSEWTDGDYPDNLCLDDNGSWWDLQTDMTICGNANCITPQKACNYYFPGTTAIVLDPADGEGNHACNITEYLVYECILYDEFPTPLINHPYDNFTWWDGSQLNKKYSRNIADTIFIDDITDYYARNHCTVELNNGSVLGKSVDDSSGNGHKGLLIGDYKIKKTKKGKPMRRDSFIKVPKKDTNEGAL